MAVEFSQTLAVVTLMRHECRAPSASRRGMFIAHRVPYDFSAPAGRHRREQAHAAPTELGWFWLLASINISLLWSGKTAGLIMTQIGTGICVIQRVRSATFMS